LDLRRVHAQPHVGLGSDRVHRHVRRGRMHAQPPRWAWMGPRLPPCWTWMRLRPMIGT
jgi:hypothetical protein